ncbi:hypothetical protein TNCV_3119181 [Trichonephila clavipes]|uniref:Uncharacterized protein n=1 Tax=Trichonephila clavipes TaxID=2585209 RepID=A0A8X6W9A7_TRICX|nr:hypothetical protein TNCV_3119181 [Trichonephila clavipes]
MADRTGGYQRPGWPKRFPSLSSRRHSSAPNSLGKGLWATGDGTRYLENHSQAKRMASELVPPLQTLKPN